MSLDFEKLLPPGTLARPADAASALPGAAMLRVNFIPGVRQRLGWRGMRECPHHPASLTARIEGKAGVYGLSLLHTDFEGRLGRAEFALNYFPAAEEDLLDSFPVEACLVAMEEDYLERVRDFAGQADLCGLFAIARLSLQFMADGGLSLSLRAPDRDVIVARDGVIVETSAGPRRLAEPGDFDKDLRSFDLAMCFLEPLAASIGYCLGEAPRRLIRASAPGERWYYGADGNSGSEPWDGARHVRFSLGWGGDAPMPTASANETTERLWVDPEPKPADYADASWWRTDAPGARNSLDKKALGIQDKPKLILLTGFLGAGKTSFLRHFIEYQARKNRFVAVVQNEIGAKGLDSRLVDQHYAAVEVDEGCVCCTLAGSLKLALADILRSFQPDFVIVETTGLANPANLLSEISELEDRMEFASITTVVDSRLGEKILADQAVARDQLRLADVILLNKADAVSENGLTRLEAAVRTLNPVAAVHRVVRGDIAPSAVYGVNTVSRRDAAAPAWGGHGQNHDHGCGGHGHVHGHTHVEEGISSRLWTAPGKIRPDAFLAAMEQLPPGVLRVKGVVELSGEAEPRLCQYVPGMCRLTPAGSVDTGERFLVFIGEDIEAALNGFEQALDA
ncbi:MAG: GTP-binding protein [Rhodospirillales bacterium]|nr:GTP-binding protein [Rhodospirillales bacterium]